MSNLVLMHYIKFVFSKEDCKIITNLLPNLYDTDAEKIEVCNPAKLFK